MLILSRVFQDGMVLQRGIPLAVWGTSNCEQEVSVLLNGRLLVRETVPPGRFTLMLPPLTASEDNVLTVGSIRLVHVDVGDVFIAAGQSNMHFPLKYDQDGPETLAHADHDHIRMYTVGEYSFPGEREWHYKDHQPWDRWLPFRPDTGREFSAVALYFALAYHQPGVPVGILHCSWGGTGIASWMPGAALTHPALRPCLEEYEERIQGLDLKRYWQVKRIACQLQFHPCREPLTGAYYRATYPPALLPAMVQAADMTRLIGRVPVDNPDGLALSALTQEELTRPGPGDANAPGALYRTMVAEIEGYAVRGVLWYQGEQDAEHGERYAEMFSVLVSAWREAWLNRNPFQNRLPFLTVQLPPFGTWKQSTGEKFPLVRSGQASCRKLPDVFMISSSDVGNVFDVHPKEKRPLGERLARMAKKVLDGEGIPADAPEGVSGVVQGDELHVSFLHGEGLRIYPADFSSYNGFPLEMIPRSLRPPVTGSVNGLQVIVDGLPLSEAECETNGNRLVIRAPGIAAAHQLRVELAQTAFYQVNLYNGAGLPAVPFSVVTAGNPSSGF